MTGAPFTPLFPPLLLPDSHSPSITHLPPELRDSIYSLTLLSPTEIVLTPTRPLSCIFKQHASAPDENGPFVRALTSLSQYPSPIREEAQSFAYVNNTFRIIAGGFEYLPVFTSFLHSVGERNRLFLRSIALMGHMYYLSGQGQTRELFELLRSCKGLRRLEMSVHFYHLFE
ncbi:hypothetical protein BDV95DRAFT_505333, partial [Massariosphaeria phaeospora]